jgi:hypothetical protein
VCTHCGYDTYSGTAAKVCTACPSGKGTLETGSKQSTDCISEFNLLIMAAHGLFDDSLIHLIKTMIQIITMQ